MKQRGKQPQQGPTQVEMDTIARLAAEGNDEAALRNAGKLVQRFPGHAYGWRAQAALHTRRRKYEVAASILAQAVKNIPDNADCWAELGYARIALGQADEAEQALQCALGTSPQRAEIMNALAGVRFSKGMLWPAFELVLRSLQLGETPINRNLFAQTVKRLKLREVSADLRLTLSRAIAEPWGIAQEFQACAWHISRTTRGLGPAIERALRAYPKLLPGSELFGEDGFFVTTNDPLLQAVLSSFPVANQEIERFLTAVRAVMLDVAVQSDKLDAATVQRAAGLCGAIATQCFINEYVFAVSAPEKEQVAALKAAIEQTLVRGEGALPAIWLMALACYTPLSRLEGAEKLLGLKAAEPLMQVLKQQVEEPHQERQLATSIVHLTPIAAGTSCDVQTMYEANPYPRWIKQTPAAYGASVDQVMRQAFPRAPYRPFNRANEAIDILVAGCGTGQHPLGVAGQFPGARILAIDLSLASLGYAKRKTLEAGVENIEYAQADITQLGILERRFDVIESSGVLHHLADPWAGWEVLIRLLRPDGLMKLGFYSEIARRDIVRAREMIAHRGYGVSVDEIRQARQDLLALDARDSLGFAVRSGDFFSTSGCRDLLFHVQEHRLTLPQIAAFLDKQHLCFIGFALDSSVIALYQQRFPEDPAARDLVNWHQFEQENPDSFVQMYQFWVQKQG